MTVFALLLGSPVLAVLAAMLALCAIIVALALLTAGANGLVRVFDGLIYIVSRLPVSDRSRKD